MARLTAARRKLDLPTFGGYHLSEVKLTRGARTQEADSRQKHRVRYCSARCVTVGRDKFRGSQRCPSDNLALQVYQRGF